MKTWKTMLLLIPTAGNVRIFSKLYFIPCLQIAFMIYTARLILYLLIVWKSNLQTINFMYCIYCKLQRSSHYAILFLVVDVHHTYHTCNCSSPVVIRARDLRPRLTFLVTFFWLVAWLVTRPPWLMTRPSDSGERRSGHSRVTFIPKTRSQLSLTGVKLNFQLKMFDL